MAYKQRQWISEQGSTLVEIKLPREILKSPEAMEVLEEHDDVQNVYANFDIPDEVLAQFKSGT